MTPIPGREEGMFAPRAFGGVDWLVMVAYGVALLVIGFIYSRRQHTTEEYFVAGRNKRPFLAGAVGTVALLYNISVQDHKSRKNRSR